MDPLPRAIRLRRAVVLGLGAVAYALLVGGPLDFVWTPFVLGVVYLAAAAAGGPRGGLWATACALLGWGLGELAFGELGIGADRGSMVLAGAGLGVLAAAALAARGFAADTLGVGATLLLAGALYALRDEVTAIREPWPYAVLLAAVAAFNLARAARG